MLKLQRRHYNFLADLLLSLRIGRSDVEHHALVCAFAVALRGTNGQFNEQRFIDRARGVKPARAKRIRARVVYNPPKEPEPSPEDYLAELDAERQAEEDQPF
jgi:hypothetical protein